MNPFKPLNPNMVQPDVQLTPGQLNQSFTPGINQGQQLPYGQQQPAQPVANPYNHSLKDRLLSVAFSDKRHSSKDRLNARGDNKAKRIAFDQHQAAQQQAAQAADLERRRGVYNDAGQVASTLLSAKPQDRGIILDHYKQNPPPGMPQGYLERFRDAPDAILQQHHDRLLGAVQVMDQRNKDRNFKETQLNNQSTRDDRQADNTRADSALANTVRGTDSLIADRTADNARADSQFTQTHSLNRQKMAQDAAQFEAIAAQKATAGPRVKKFNDGQSSAAVFAHRAGAAQNELAALETKFDPSGIRAPLESLRSSEGRQYDRAKREFVNAILRKESGAAISEAEFTNADKQYFPSFGDDKQTIAAKKVARERAIHELGAQSQGALESFFSNQPKTNVNPDMEGKTATNPQTGQTIIYRNGQWVPK